MRRATVFHQIDPLPCSQLHPSANDRDLQTDRKHRSLQMCGHVVRALVTVGDPPHRRVIGGWRNPVQPVEKIDLNIRIGIFLNG